MAIISDELELMKLQNQSRIYHRKTQ